MGVSACFVSHGRSFLIRGYSCPLKPQQGIRFAHSFFKRGQPPLIVVLACGSLGLIGLSRFLQCSVSFFLPQPFLAVFAVFALVVPPDAHTAKHCLSQASVPSFIRSFRKLHSLLQAATLAFPAKKLHFTAKNAPALPLRGRQSQPSFRYAPLRAICVCHPRSTRSRLAPLHSAGKKSLRYRSADFLPAPFRLKAVLPALFLCYTRANPRPPTPKTVEFFILFALPRRFLNCIVLQFQFFLPEKKEYAKVAITLTVSQGQALRVFEKIFLFFLNASLKKKSIFPKNLDSRRCIAVGFAYPFFLLSFLFILFRGKK